MGIVEALTIVLELAKQNALDLNEADGNEQVEQAMRQQAAIKLVEDLIDLETG